MENIEIGEIFSISDEEDNEHEVEVLGKMNVDGKEYIAVGFVEELEQESEDEIDIFFLRVEEDGEFSYIEEDSEFEKVSASFEEVMAEQE